MDLAVLSNACFNIYTYYKVIEIPHYNRVMNIFKSVLGISLLAFTIFPFLFIFSKYIPYYLHKAKYPNPL